MMRSLDTGPTSGGTDRAYELSDFDPPDSDFVFVQASSPLDDDATDYDDDDSDAAPPYAAPPARSPAYAPRLFATRPHLAVLPVLLLEFLALALTRAVLPSLLLARYGARTYLVMGAAECVRGVVAFVACPLFGRLSDVVGRRPCLLVTVAGTLAPVCSLAFWRVEGMDDDAGGGGGRAAVGGGADAAALGGVDAGEASEGGGYPTFLGEHLALSLDFLPSPHRIDVFVVLLALSGFFSATFTLTFAYISDVVQDRDGRVAAFGLALATFGLSFTIGPLLGGYLVHVDDEDDGAASGALHPVGQLRVFTACLLLAILDLFYIHFFLPESLPGKGAGEGAARDGPERGAGGTPSSRAVAAHSSASVARQASAAWSNPLDGVRYLATDPLLATVGKVTFLYYTALHAVVSTLVLYAERQFHLGPRRLGELMAALGLSTMVSEAVLVRVAIALCGETRCIRMGLVSFATQCLLLAVADAPWHLFACALFAMVGNLVYPSLSSLVSSHVEPDMVGRALGAVNGVKSLTEGVGPLVFGTLLTMSENDRLPGWPYFLAAVMVAFAYQAGRTLPDDCGNYAPEDYGDARPGRTGRREVASAILEEEFGLLDCDER